MSIPLSALIQQAVNPNRIKYETIQIASYGPGNFASDTQTNLLDIKEGATRWTWDDFVSLDFEVAGDRAERYSESPISLPTWKATRINNQLNLDFRNRFSVWWVNASGFRIGFISDHTFATQTANTIFLKAIYGTRMTIELENANG